MSGRLSSTDPGNSRITVRVPDPMEADIEALVDGDEYASKSDVVRDALYAFEAFEQIDGGVE
jgi:Arc/MetJ-type ribon-helix-helix transcriptional regulator